jgi:hypothetical protein
MGSVGKEQFELTLRALSEEYSTALPVEQEQDAGGLCRTDHTDSGIAHIGLELGHSAVEHRNRPNGELSLFPVSLDSPHSGSYYTSSAVLCPRVLAVTRHRTHMAIGFA